MMKSEHCIAQLEIKGVQWTASCIEARYVKVVAFGVPVIKGQVALNSTDSKAKTIPRAWSPRLGVAITFP